MNLDVPREFLSVWNHNLGLRIVERYGKWIIVVFLLMLFDSLGEARVVIDGFDYGALEDNLYARLLRQSKMSRSFWRAWQKASDCSER